MKHFVWLVFFFSLSSQAQFLINGIIKDASTKNTLPFASIVTNTGQFVLSDVDGKFNLVLEKSCTTLTVSYIGFSKINIPITTDKKFYTILMTPVSNALNEVVISNENPALELIKKVIQRSPQNNPQNKLKSFDFKSYNKLIITANPDSIEGRIDSIFIKKTIGKKLKTVDSSEFKFKKIIARQHVFQTEKVSQFQYNNTGLKETILGTKMSGFKKAIYEILALNLQSFSIYDNQYELFETKYKSPISKFYYTDYRFKLLDSTTIQGRKTYMIYFKNKKKSKATGLEGVLYIDPVTLGVAKAVMRIKGILDISGTHEFDYVSEQQLWFPTHKIFKIVKGKNNNDIHVLGETLQFDTDESEATENRRKDASDATYLISETQSFDLHYNTFFKIQNTYSHMEVQADAENQPESFWNQYRTTPLDERSVRTYVALDSISTKKNIEKRLLFGRKVLNGYVPFGPFDLDLRYLISYNNYEGFRVGLGGKTSEKFSRKFRIDGYTAYGTKDGRYKYSLGFATRVAPYSNSWIGGSYTDDVREIGSTSFAIDKRVFKIYDPRPINVSTFYNYRSWRLYYETKTIPKTESIFQMIYAENEPKFDYTYTVDGVAFQKYKMTTAQVSAQWNPFSDYIQTPNGRYESEKRYPRFTFQYTQSLPQLLQNDFKFGKIDFRTEYEKKHLNGQKTSLLLEAGYAYGDVPLTHLYNTAPNNLTKDKIMQRITLAGKNSFETMFFNEFFSSQYAEFQMKHGFKKVTLFKKVKPTLVLVTRMVYGKMDKKEQHTGLTFKTLEKGFYESGIELNQIYSGFGLIGFFRYGPNQLPKFEDNLAIKLSFVLNLGF